jgi:hypothetical protein
MDNSFVVYLMPVFYPHISMIARSNPGLQAQKLVHNPRIHTVKQSGIGDGMFLVACPGLCFFERATDLLVEIEIGVIEKKQYYYGLKLNYCDFIVFIQTSSAIISKILGLFRQLVLASSRPELTEN